MSKVTGETLEMAVHELVHRVLSEESPDDGVWSIEWKQGDETGTVNVSVEALEDIMSGDSPIETLTRHVSTFAGL